MVSRNLRPSYVPILKGKPGEGLGLRRLRTPLKSEVLPQFVVPSPSNWDADDPKRLDIDACQTKMGDLLGRYWKGRPALLDPRNLSAATSNPSSLIDFVRIARQYGSQPISMLTLGDEPWMVEAVRDVVLRYDRVAGVRLTISQLEDDHLGERLLGLVSGLGLAPSEVVLGVDLGPISAGFVAEMAPDVIRGLARIPKINEWQLFYLASTAFPEKVTVRPGQAVVYPRAEKVLFSAIERGGVIRGPIFSDYAAEYPNFHNMKDARASTQMRYAVGGGWVVTKGLTIREAGYAGITLACDMVAHHDEYDGPPFSWAEEFISGRLDRGQVGNPTFWKGVNTCRHITKVLEERGGRELIQVANSREEFQPDLF